MASTRSWLDNLKIRVSAGTAGNGLISNAYAYMSLMGFAQSSAVVSGGQPFKYATAPTPVPDGLTWEKATTYDLGLDLEMLNGRFNLTADIYRRNTTDMYVVGAELPAVSAGVTGNAEIRTAAGGIGAVNIVVNAAPGQSEQAIADAVMRRMQSEVSKKGAVW